MIPLRAAIPSTVRKPTSEPSEIDPPPMNVASTPPTSAMGSARKATAAMRQLPKDRCSSMKMPTAAARARAAGVPAAGGGSRGDGVAGLQRVWWGRGWVVLALHLGPAGQRLAEQQEEAAKPRHGWFYFGRLGAQDIQVGPENAHDDR